MASTNKTPNVGLSQFLGTDKPTWLTDYNGDMLKIDTAITENKGSSSDAQSAAENALNVANLANSKSDANTTAVNNLDVKVNAFDSRITTAQNTANNASTMASTLNSNILNWQILSFTNPNPSKFTNYTINGYYNATLNILKIFGSFRSNSNISNTDILVQLPANLYPKEEKILYFMGATTSTYASVDNMSRFTGTINTRGELKQGYTTNNQFLCMDATFITYNWFD